MTITRRELIILIKIALYNYEDNQGTIREATFGDLADHIVENGFSGYIGKELVAPVVPVIPFV
jgi:hypothetical protein